MKVIFALAAALAAVLSVTAEFTSKDKVVILNDANFKSLVLESNKLWVVDFYAPWCGHCQALEPEYKYAAKHVESRIKFGAVDATENQALAAKYGIRGYPSIKIFGLDKSKPKEYRAGRTAQDLVSGAEGALKAMDAEARGESSNPESPYGDDVVILTSDNFESVVKSAEKPVLVKFYAPWCGHCKSMVPAWSAAAADVEDQAIIAAVDATVEQTIAEQYEVRGFPTIKVFLPGEDMPVDYTGMRTAEAILAYIDEISTVPSVGAFQITDPEEFERRCHKGICVVAALPHLIDGGVQHRMKYLNVLNEMATKFRKGYSFAWYAAGEQNALDEALGVTMYPTLEAVNFGKGRHTRHVQAFDSAHVYQWLQRPTASSALASTNPKIRAREPWDGKDYVPPEE